MSLWRKDDIPLPALAITPLSDDLYMLFDSRGLDGTEEIQFVDRLQASVALTGRRLGERDETVEWAIDAPRDGRTRAAARVRGRTPCRAARAGGGLTAGRDDSPGRG